MKKLLLLLTILFCLRAESGGDIFRTKYFCSYGRSTGSLQHTGKQVATTVECLFYNSDLKTVIIVPKAGLLKSLIIGPVVKRDSLPNGDYIIRYKVISPSPMRFGIYRTRAGLINSFGIEADGTTIVLFVRPIETLLL